MTAFWLFTPYIISGLYRRFGETCRLHLPIDQIWFKTIAVVFVNTNANTCYARDSSIRRNVVE